MFVCLYDRIFRFASPVEKLGRREGRGVAQKKDICAVVCFVLPPPYLEGALYSTADTRTAGATLPTHLAFATKKKTKNCPYLWACLLA